VFRLCMRWEEFCIYKRYLEIIVLCICFEPALTSKHCTQTSLNTIVVMTKRGQFFNHFFVCLFIFYFIVYFFYLHIILKKIIKMQIRIQTGRVEGRGECVRIETRQKPLLAIAQSDNLFCCCSGSGRERN
jgi:hypothetical protein